MKGTTLWAGRLAAVATCLATVAGTAAPAAASPVRTAAVATAEQLTAGEDYLRAFMARTRAPGMAFAVVRGDQVLRQAPGASTATASR